MRMCILVEGPVPVGFAILAAFHASLAAYLKLADMPEVAVWLSGPFCKVVCKVTEDGFEEARTVEDHVFLTESGLGGPEVAIALKPREEWPGTFKFLRLYKS